MSDDPRVQSLGLVLLVSDVVESRRLAARDAETRVLTASIALERARRDLAEAVSLMESTLRLASKVRTE